MLALLASRTLDWSCTALARFDFVSHRPVLLIMLFGALIVALVRYVRTDGWGSEGFRRLIFYGAALVLACAGVYYHFETKAAMQQYFLEVHPALLDEAVIRALAKADASFSAEQKMIFRNHSAEKMKWFNEEISIRDQRLGLAAALLSLSAGLLLLLGGRPTLEIEWILLILAVCVLFSNVFVQVMFIGQR